MDQDHVAPAGFRDGSEEIVGACIEVHRHLGPGLLESAYEQCLVHELSLRGFRVERHRWIPVAYKGMQIDCGYRLDLVVDDTFILELKSVDRLLPIHLAQLLTYLKVTGLQTGFLVNFNVALLKHGLRRLTHSPSLPSPLPDFLPSCKFPSPPRPL